MKTMSLAAAKTRFSALVEEAVATHQQVTVTRNGEPAVVVLAVEDFESLVETLAICRILRIGRSLNGLAARLMTVR